MEDNDIAAFLHALNGANNPQKLAALIESNRADDKLRVRADEEHRKVVAKCHALLVSAKDAHQLDELVKLLKKKDASLKSNDAHLVLLRAFIDYGDDGKQFASRDKANLQLLEAEKVPPRDAPQFIKEKGGLVACADLWRRTKRGDGTSTKEDNTKHTLAWVRKEYLKAPEDLALLIVRKPKKKVQISKSIGLIPIADREKRIEFYKELKRLLKVYINGEFGG